MVVCISKDVKRMSKLSKLAKTLLNLPVGSLIDDEEFRDLLKYHPRFSKAASSPDYSIHVRKRRIAKRLITVLCLEGKGKSIPMTMTALKGGCKVDKRQEVLKAMRNMIKYQIVNHRKNHKKAMREALKNNDTEEFIRLSTCPYSGNKISSMKTHVHHAGKPFIQLVEEWLQENNLQIDTIKLKGRNSFKKFKDESLEDSWCRYHSENSVLEIISAVENMRMGAGDYSPGQSTL